MTDRLPPPPNVPNDGKPTAVPASKYSRRRTLIAQLNKYPGPAYEDEVVSALHKLSDAEWDAIMTMITFRYSR